MKIVKNFYPEAKKLRQHFDLVQKDGRSTQSQRFVWDHWYVPDQYCHLRTPAYLYFPKGEYLKFHKHLVLWGRKYLGCWDVSPPWMSLYLDGHSQDWHCDQPHGPWAFVYSLTPFQNLKTKKFSGGQTALLRKEALQFHQVLRNDSLIETGQLMETVEPYFNQLVVFDPSRPHCVRKVSGTQDPCEGRLVIHGWFHRPKTFIEGSLPSRICEAKLNQGIHYVEELLSHHDLVTGTASLFLRVNRQGQVDVAKFLTAHLHMPSTDVLPIVMRSILKIYRQLEFPISKGSTEITIPLIFSA